MNITLQHSEIKKTSEIRITGSKSESNRLLILKALFKQLNLENVSNSDDSQLMQKALSSNAALIDISHAGTAMRFLTAYFASQPGREVILTGSHRMKERPIKVLVDALRDLGANIAYTENEGFPPLKISGKKIEKQDVSLQANVSSQYISALLLNAVSFKNGITLHLEGKITSEPYIKMTLSLLNEIGLTTRFEENTITVEPFVKKDTLQTQTLVVESDWSSASYYYSIVALSPVGTQIKLLAYHKNSLQGDSCLRTIYTHFGVHTQFEGNSIILSKKDTKITHFNCDLVNAPDIAQTLAVTCFGLHVSCDLTGLHTLKIKETDRLMALKTEIEKLGGIVEITNESLHLKATATIIPMVTINTYHDHRMAMAFAPLALKTDIIIADADVVSKSYPTFWDDMQNIGIKISK